MGQKLTIKAREQKERIKKNQDKIKDEISSLTGKEELKYDIGILKGRIKNCLYDLKVMKDNPMIKNTLIIFKNQLNEKEKLLNAINHTTTK